ncbi:MAG: hypothetical protein V3V98_03395 [Thermoplasmata archaeon]
MRNLSLYVAPWALPGETIPLYVEWEPTDDEDFRFRVELPEDSQFERATNVKRMTKRKHRLYINELEGEGFFGIHFSPPRTQKRLIKTRRIIINRLVGRKVATRRVLRFRTVRPKLELVKCPTEIVVTDRTARTKALNVKLRQLGAGFVRIEVSVYAGGRILSSHEDLIWNFLRAMIEKEIISKEDLKRMRMEYGLKEPTVEVSDQLIGKLEEEFRSLLETVPSLDEESGLEFASETIQGLKDIDPVKFIELIVEQFELFLTGELIRALNKYPGDKSMLIGGRASASLSKSVDRIDVAIRYRDSVGNEYDPIECEIDVRDKREKFKGELIPVNITVKKAWLQSLGGGN